jgi:hypothetical protein
VRGIQLGLAFTLAIAAAEMINQNIMLSAVLLMVALLLLKNRVIPSSIFLVLFGFIYSAVMGSLNLSKVAIGFSLPSISFFTLDDIVYGFIYAGFAQLFLTLTNAVVATVALIHDLFPDRKDVTPRNLIQNMGAMNVVIPFIGGMPLCHGAGGLAAQYLFGARTGGAILMEGLLEISLGLFFSESLVMIFTSFPMFVVGVMLLMTSFELGRVSFKVEGEKNTFVMLVTATLSIVFNIAIGFLGGLLTYIALEKEIIKI